MPLVVVFVVEGYLLDRLGDHAPGLDVRRPVARNPRAGFPGNVTQAARVIANDDVLRHAGNNKGKDD
jgi:hypothetical protein